MQIKPCVNLAFKIWWKKKNQEGGGSHASFLRQVECEIRVGPGVLSRGVRGECSSIEQPAVLKAGLGI